jgi:EmrB/QacA subfamily drug resistance transporter
LHKATDRRGSGGGKLGGPAVARKWIVLAVTSLGVFMAFLDTTVVNIAFNTIAQHFAGTRLDDLSWVLNGYTVLFAASLIPAGRIADRVGRKRVFMTGLIIFTLASAACGAAPSAGALIAARFVEGIGAAAMIPSALGLVLPEFPDEQRSLAIGLWGVAGALAGAAGTPLGGVVVQLAGWRWIFLLNLPIGALALLLGWRLLSERREQAGTRIPDLIGALLLAAAVGVLALGIVKGAEWGWLSARALGCAVAAIALTAGFIQRSARHPAPIMELGLWRVRSFSVANIATLAYAMGLFALFLCAALFLTTVWRYSTLRAGLAIAPGPTMVGLFGVIAGRLADRRGQRGLIVLGQLLVAVGMFWLVVRLQARPEFLRVWLPGYLVIGMGFGLTLPSLTSAAVAELPADRYATGGAANNTARQIGAALGVALLIAIIGSPSAAGAMRAFQHGFLFCAGCAIATSLIGLALGQVRVHSALRGEQCDAPVSAVAGG